MASISLVAMIDRGDDPAQDSRTGARRSKAEIETVDPRNRFEVGDQVIDQRQFKVLHKLLCYRWALVFVRPCAFCLLLDLDLSFARMNSSGASVGCKL